MENGWNAHSVYDVYTGKTTALHLASKAGDKYLVEFLLGLGAESKRDILKKEELTWDNAVHAAVRGGNPAVLHLLLNNVDDKADTANSMNKSGQTPMHLAVMGGKLEMVSELVKVGASPHQKDDTGATPLSLSVQSGNDDLLKTVVHALFKHTSSTDDLKRGLDTLRSYQEDETIMERFKTLKLGPWEFDNVYAGKTALHVAAENRNKSLAVRLIHEGTDVLKQDEVDGNTALHAAARAGDEYILYKLHEKVRDVDVINHARQTPLHLAVMEGHDFPVAQLIAYGADPHYKDNRGTTPLHLAARHKDSLVFKALLETLLKRIWKTTTTRHKLEEEFSLLRNYAEESDISERFKSLNYDPSWHID